MKKLGEENFPITYEVPSPRGANVDDYIEHIKEYEFLEDIAGFNVCNNPVGLVRIDPGPYAGKIKDEVGIDTIAHLTCRDSTIGGLQRWLLGAQSLGIKNILAMTGDFAVGDYPAEEKVDHINSLELITGIKEYLNKGKLMPELSARPHKTRNRYLNEIDEIEIPTDFIVGGVILPGRNKEPGYAARKVEAGADFFQTQITYDHTEMLDFLEKLEDRVDRCPPILIGTTPFQSPKQMMELSDTIPQVNIPDSVQERLSKADDFKSESVEFTIEFYEKIKDGAKERGIKTKLGAHIIPIKYEGRVNEIIHRIGKI